MGDILQFITSDAGVAVAWFCSVGSTLYAIFLKRKNAALKLSISSINMNKTTSDESADNSTKSVTQNAEKSVYTDKNIGDINIQM